MKNNTYEKEFLKVKAFAFDVDGVCTNGNIMLFPGNEFIRTMNIKDGYAIQYCIKQGYPMAIITGGNSETIKKRFNYLGVTNIYMKSSHKFLDYEDFRKRNKLEHKDILYMGDDLPDYEIMQHAGIPVCPADAVDEIKQLALYVSCKNGGEGCVRDVIEQVLKLQGKWMIDGAFLW